jgi:hypothetical protein
MSQYKPKSSLQVKNAVEAQYPAQAKTTVHRAAVPRFHQVNQTHGRYKRKCGCILMFDPDVTLHAINCLLAQSPKSFQLRQIVAAQFRKHKDIVDPAVLHQLKSM